MPDFGSLRRSMRSSISGRCGGGIAGGTVLSAGRGAGTWAGASWWPRTQNEPPFWRYNAAGKQLMFSGYHMSPRNLGAYVDELRKRRPPWLHGYPSLLSFVGELHCG